MPATAPWLLARFARDERKREKCVASLRCLSFLGFWVACVAGRGFGVFGLEGGRGDPLSATAEAGQRPAKQPKVSGMEPFSARANVAGALMKAVFGGRVSRLPGVPGGPLNAEESWRINGGGERILDDVLSPGK